MHQSNRFYDDLQKCPSLLQREIHSTIPKRCLYFARRGTELLDWVVCSCHSRSRRSLQQGSQSKRLPGLLYRFPSMPHQPVKERASQQAPPPWPACAPLSRLDPLHLGALIKSGAPIGAPRQPTRALSSAFSLDVIRMPTRAPCRLDTLTSTFPEGLRCFLMI